MTQKQNLLRTDNGRTADTRDRLVDGLKLSELIWDIQQSQLDGSLSTRQSTNRHGQKVIAFTFTATTGTQISKLDQTVEWIESTRCLNRETFFAACGWACGSVDLWNKAIKKLRARGRVTKARNRNVWAS